MSNPNASPELRWEDAYSRFETSQEEIDKFIHRLRRLGIDGETGQFKVVELFAGRANGLEALKRLGFSHCFGIDLSLRLISTSQLRHRTSAADARTLPIRTASIDIVIVQGGLHHLDTLPADLDATLTEIVRILRPAGRFYLVEPALTPFLSLVHAICSWRLARLLSNRIDALATMIELEMPTYQLWLQNEPDTMHRLRARFDPIYSEKRFGKLLFAGRKR
jgi:SAM-dependent methyltransferase